MIWGVGAVLLILAAIFSETFRDFIAESLGLAWDISAMILRRVLILWVVLIGAFTLVGWMIGSPVAGLLLGISVPACIVLLFRSEGFRKFTSRAAATCVVIAFVLFSIGLVSPTFKKSLNRWTGGRLVGWSIWMDKDSVASEAENGVEGLSVRGAPVYSPDVLVVMTHTPKDQSTVVKVTNLKADKDGLLPVILKNAEGNYIGGTKGRMVVNDLNLNWKRPTAQVQKGEGLWGGVPWFAEVPFNDPAAGFISLPPGEYRIRPIAGLRWQYIGHATNRPRSVQMDPFGGSLEIGSACYDGALMIPLLPVPNACPWAVVVNNRPLERKGWTNLGFVKGGVNITLNVPNQIDNRDRIDPILNFSRNQGGFRFEIQSRV